MKTEKMSAISEFQFEGKLQECIPFGNGHINDTYRLTFETEHGMRHYILQRMNTQIFTKPEELMENMEGVTSWLKRKIAEQGGDPKREALKLGPTIR